MANWKRVLTTASDGILPVANGGTAAADISTARSNLGLEIAVDVQAYSGNLQTIHDAGAPTDSNILVGNGAAWTKETGATARTSLGVDEAGTDNSTNVTLASVSSNYLSITGQAITAGTVPVSLGGTGATSASSARANLGLTLGSVQNGGTTIPTTNDVYDFVVLQGYSTATGVANNADVTGSNACNSPNVVYPAETQATINALDITEVGTISSGEWRGTIVDPSSGGTGLSSISTLLNSNVTLGTLGLGTSDSPHFGNLLLGTNSGGNKWLNFSTTTGESGLCWYEDSTYSIPNHRYGAKLYYDESFDRMIVSTMQDNVEKFHIRMRRASSHTEFGADAEFDEDSGVRFYDTPHQISSTSANSGDYIKLQAPDTVGTSYTLKLPANTGSADQVIKTDGSGNLDWVDQSGGGGTSEFFVEWGMRWYMRYGYYYYPNHSYGPGYYNWTKWSASPITAWQDSWNIQYYVPCDCTFKGAVLIGTSTNTETAQLTILSGTPSSNNNSSASITLSSIYAPTAESWTDDRRNSMGSLTGATVSLDRGDIIVPQLNKTTNTGSSTNRYLYATLILKFET